MKAFLEKHNVSIFIVLILLLFTGCSEIGLLSEDNSWVVKEINSTRDFFKVYLVLQLSIFIVGLLIGIIFSKTGYKISLLIHFIWIISARSYGFLMVFLLFGLFFIASYFLLFLYFIYSWIKGE